MNFPDPPKQRFANLDGLRFFFALVVLMVHVSANKAYWGYGSINNDFLHITGQLAVTSFFVLSGFLISFLLLKEKMNSGSGDINIRSFYRKRILRIWPVYYLMILLAFFILNRIDAYNNPGYPHDFVWQRFAAYIFFMPNTAQIFFKHQTFLGPAWSLGVEEFFYLFFPLFISKLKLRYIPHFLIIAAILSVTISILFPILNSRGADWRLNVIGIYVDRYRLYSFFLGGIVAWIISNSEMYGRSIRFFNTNRYSKWIIIITIVVIILIGSFSAFKDQAYSFLFSILLFVTIITKTEFRFLNLKAIQYLGKISFGIYMFHSLVIVLTIHLIRGTMQNNIIEEILIYILSIAGTVMVSMISYEFYEKYFLAMRGEKKIR